LNDASWEDRGTLMQLKIDFGHRSVTMDAMNSFNYNEKFIRFAVYV